VSKYVDWFVDRQKQYKGFLKMVSRETPKQIMFVEAEADMGKTWLIQRLRHECRSQEIPVAHFDFLGRRPLDYLAMVRHARDELGPIHFNPMTESINAATGVTVQIDAGPTDGSSPGSGVQISLAEGGEIRDSEIVIGDVAGGHIIKDNYFYVQADSDEIQANARARILDAFFECLSLLARQRVVVFLFDAYEGAKEQARAWVEGELLDRVRYEHLPDVIVVLAGRTTPVIDRDSWDHILAFTDLDLFTADDVKDYLAQRGQTHLHLQTMVLASGRHPARLGEMVDSALVSVAEKDEDWL
jgi:hypothetical protein